MIVVDAGVLIAQLDERDAHHARAVALLLDWVEQPLGCAPLTLAEILVGPARSGRLDAAETALADLAVHEIPLGDGAARRLARLRAETGLKLPDCCVLLAAQDASATAILSFDDRLSRAAAKLGFGVQTGRR